jgi:predicted site-specific integrase-resolvase
MQASELESTVKVPRLLTLAAVAQALAVSTHSVRKWVRMGKLRPIRICRRLLFSPDEITRFLAGAK